jgi:Holliday junction resolvasome RuvABC endonuclease subunit
VLLPDRLIVKRFRPGDLRGVARLKWLMDNVAAEVTRHQSQLALIEGYSFASANSHAHSLGELGGVVRLGLAMIGVPMATAAPGCWKKALTGNGAPKGKGVISLELFKRYGVEIVQDDMADATSLAVVAAMVTGQVAPTSQLQQAGLAKVDVIEPLPLPKVRHRERPEAGEAAEKLQPVATDA